MAIVVNRSITSSDEQTQRMLNLFYPVGSYYETSNTSFDPNNAWCGTWVEDTAGRVLVAQDAGTFATVGDTGGEETHTLVTAEMPSHNHELAFHGISGSTEQGKGVPFMGDGNDYIGKDARGVYSTGGDGAHNNLQPYLVVKRWHRVS